MNNLKNDLDIDIIEVSVNKDEWIFFNSPWMIFIFKNDNFVSEVRIYPKETDGDMVVEIDISPYFATDFQEVNEVLSEMLAKKWDKDKFNRAEFIKCYYNGDVNYWDNMTCDVETMYNLLQK
ncbi:hypothetical protein QWT87_13795 [Chryseobacterium sp. APV1]|uniref:Uncharacterized protein n=1 Tax=Chryseobacterium urinae TaxID=3058400 RepID=A0ABT8U4G8_9FLAO|nr:hypothetical protein [Chryseobacterium sp. APV1]MDO3425969.1 hypothetical protein [Chryseobacterium sp. APV1]